jgi:integrase
MALSDMAVRQAKAAGKVYTLNDIDGLSLSISARGGKSWHFRYYWQGKQKRISLGTYPETSLREARQTRDEARALLAKGVNPRVHRRQERLAGRLADENIFDLVFTQWMEHRKLEIKTAGKRSTHYKIMQVFSKDILPFLGKLPIHEIKRGDLLEVVARIEHRNALTIARFVRGWLRQVFRYALVKVPGLENNPAADLGIVAVPQRPTRHNPFLRMDGLPEFLRTLRAHESEPVRRALFLLLLTGVRTGELRQATPGQFDLERGLWTIPPENVKQLQRKMRKSGGCRSLDIPSYLVPLSTQAMEIVRELLGWRGLAQRYLLAHRDDSQKRLGENALNEALRSLGYGGRLTGHGMRGTLSTALNEIGYPRVWVEAQLSHSDPNQVRAAYNHAEYLEQRRRMMQDWADRLDLFEQGEVERASRPLVVHLEGVATTPDVLDELTDADRLVAA